MKAKRTYNLDKMANSFDRKWGPQTINDIVDVVHKDIIEGVQKRKNIDDSRTKKLKQATIDAKKRKGSMQPDLPRVDAGAMSGALGGLRIKTIGQNVAGGPFVSLRAKPGKLKAILRTAARAFYGIYQHESRPWFGIAKRTQIAVGRVIRTRTVKMVKSAHTGRLK